MMIRFIVQGVLVSLLALVLGACNTANSDAPPVNAVHLEGWLVEHGGEAADDVEGCKVCHAIDFTADSYSSVVVCMSCHSTSPEADSSGCISCHGKPPVMGAHATHDALAGVTDVCSTCHEDGGSGSEVHFDGVTDVAIDPTYDAMSGAALYNGDGTCSNVSCHGGQDTPNMETGSIDVNTECTSCHALGTDQYNSYNSGRHVTHAGAGGYWGGICSNCHDVTALAIDHFSGLDTPELDDAAVTINSSNIDTYDSNAGTCIAKCHSDYPNERSW
jgi:predicted CxxxxCH...CXXCH cytochrome family protein